MKNKIIKLILSLILSLSVISNFSYASIDYNDLLNDEMIDKNFNNIEDVPTVDTSLKVYDFGNILDDSEEIKIKNTIDEFIFKTNYDFAVVTKADVYANDFDDEMFADNFYDYNDFGNISEYKDGILLLIDVRNNVEGNRYCYISTSGNAMLTIDDARIDNILDEFCYENEYIYDESGYFKQTYSEGICRAIELAGDYIEEGIPTTNKDAWIDDEGNYQYERGHYRSTLSLSEKIIQGLGISFIISIIITLIFYFINKSKLNNRKIATSANLYLKNDSINFTKKEDRFLTTHTVSHRIESSNSSGHGGSSIHTSSSGHSHGGGGRHF